MNNFNQLMKQAQEMQAKLMEAQNKMNDLEIEGTAGGGMVKVTINGKSEMKKIVIDPSFNAIGDIEMLCDLVVAAHNDARSKLESKMSQEMGGLMPAGMKLPF